MRAADRSDFAALLIAWQRSHGRNSLPWQGSRDPYRVWLSEIMLQQTQVATVLGYYERFLARFPEVAALAAASQDDVLALWSGLGYYSRARNLHRCAQAVVEHHGGRFPASSVALAELLGIGRSTAAAIAAFCFGERVAILDGNVKRVLTRVLAFDGDLADAAPQRELWQRATELLPTRGIEPYTQGLMDLGATLCTTRSPGCVRCPAQGLCRAKAAGTVANYPVKTRRLVRGARESLWLRLEWQEQLWLVKRPARGVWAGLWSLPEFGSQAELDAATADWPGKADALPSFTHVLTHFDWLLHPLRWCWPKRLSAARAASMTRPWPEGRWFGRDEALAAGLPAPLRRLIVES